jgi:uncharacterized damage-inducible protein DinB
MTTTEIVEALRSAPAELRALVSPLPPDRLDRTEAEGWTVREVLAHLADFELIAGVRVRAYLTLDRPALASYDQDRFTARFGHLGSAADALERIAVNREATAAVLAAIEDADWERPGVHPHRGEETLRRSMEHLVAHDRGHLEQLRLAAG